jgi:hypothetical protein
MAEEIFVTPVPAHETRYEAFQKMRALIPPEASVAGSSGFLAHVGNRRQLFTYPDDGGAEWLILSSAYGNPWPLNRDQAAAHIIRLQRNPAYKLVEHAAGMYLFQRVAPAQPGD